MIFWTGTALALLLAAVMVKKGLYETWTLFFNIVIAVYLGLTLGPVLKNLLGIDKAGVEVLVLLGTAVVCLIVLYLFSYIIFLSQFHVTFPKLLDSAGGGLLGFLTGFLIYSFVVFLICVSPLNPYAKKIGFNSTSIQSSTNYIQWWTGLLHHIVSADQKQESLDQTISTLIENADKNYQAKKVVVEQNEPAEPVQTEVVEKKITPADLGPPPELESEDI
jgi:uncharacterized membrane protein required for colicin V production